MNDIRALPSFWDPTEVQPQPGSTFSVFSVDRIDPNHINEDVKVISFLKFLLLTALDTETYVFWTIHGQQHPPDKRGLDSVSPPQHPFGYRDLSTICFFCRSYRR